MIHIGNDLRYLIERRGLAKKTVAAHLDMAEPSFYSVLKKDHISTKLLTKFCELLEVHPAVFFNHYEGAGAENVELKVYGDEDDAAVLLAGDEQRAGMNAPAKDSSQGTTAVRDPAAKNQVTPQEIARCEAEKEMMQREIDLLNRQVLDLRDHVDSLKQIAGLKRETG